MKKADKGHEGQTKAIESIMPKFYDSFISTWSFGILYWQIWMFLSFKAIKAKKATLVAGNANLHCGIFVDSKLLLYCQMVLFKLPLTQNRADKKTGDFKRQNVQ